MKKLLLCIYIAFIGSPLIAQDSTVVRDFELWTGVSAKKSFLDNKLKLGLNQEFRFNDNSTRINNYFTELEASYKFYGNFEAGGGFRYIRNNTNSGYKNENRFFVDLGYGHKFNQLKIDYRLRYQNQREFSSSKDDLLNPTSKFRLKIKLDYNIKNWKLDPYLAIESFYTTTLNAVSYVEPIIESSRVNGFEKIRFTLGTNYKINNLMSLGGFYRIEKEFKSFPLVYNTPATYFIAGLNLTFNF
jgi:hypothetical protein